MKKVLVNYGGVLLFYIVLFFGVLFVCASNTPSSAKPSSFGTSITASK